MCATYVQAGVDIEITSQVPNSPTYTPFHAYMQMYTRTQTNTHTHTGTRIRVRKINYQALPMTIV